MKRLLTITMMLVMSITTWMAQTAEAQNKMFRKYGDMDNVEYICITRPMLKLMGKNSATINGVHIEGMTDVLQVILIINSDEKISQKIMDEDYEKLRDNDDYEVFLEIRQNDEHIVTMLNSRQEVKEVVMYIMNKASGNRVFIVMTGKFTDEQLAKLLNN